jgi:cell division transport system ATP-binding protein
LSLIGAVGGARMMRLENGKLSDPTGELRNPPSRLADGSAA